MKAFYAIKGLFLYFSLIREHMEDFNSKFNFRKDWIGRIYTVINMPNFENQYEDPQSLKLAKDRHLRAKVFEIDKYLSENNLKELISPDRIQQLDEDNFLFVLGYRRINLKSLARVITLFSILLISSLIFLAIIYI